ncbi:MAG: tetratricopeptide repeat protein [Candidatus Eisenbacteria bacterium]|uniref:Tetratricopeptide repeat protein n=1 Tax=Eiseniibacteriota bacterium TaxID=2212470 RepID=A0A538SUL6_UNCEI|nr:MAG: tetratricopeptide repeat protein [Candidatus Eisenbacteria bacterium]
MRSKGRVARQVLPVLLLAVVSAVTPASGAARKAAPRTAAASPVPPLREAARAFEAAQLLSGAARLAALDDLDRSLPKIVEGSGSAERSAALALSGAVRYARANFAGAEDAYRKSMKGAEKSPFADDAAFAAIRSVEAQGQDAEAAREWAKWEKDWPHSPLFHEARLARAWNAMRRGDLEDARKTLTALTAGAPWSSADPRVTLARATELALDKKPADALSVLGPVHPGAAATYLYALCQSESHSLLRAAAAFQEVADRYPGSPLREAALLGKANAFLAARDYHSAASEYARITSLVSDPAIRAEAELRGAGSLFLTGANDSALTLLRGVVARNREGDVAARAQFLVGEVLTAEGKPAQAIVEYNRVLTSYFRHAVAASAQYRVARSLDALGRRADATGSYEAVVRGYPLEPEAPAAAYLAGVGLLAQNRPLAAAPYFQLVLDRYAGRSDPNGLVVFASPEHQELVEAALCLLELSYHRAGNLGQLSGAPHLLLQHMPASHSTWRAYAILIDADAAAAMARYADARTALEALIRDFPDHPLGASATRLLAWTYSREGEDSLAIATEERLLARYGAHGDDAVVSGAMLDIAHERFNQRRFREAAAAYEDFLRRYPAHPKRLTALYQAGLCYMRLDRAGDAVDRWETIMRDSADSPVAERAWARTGDLYFQADRFADAKRCYRGLLEHFAGSSAAAIAMLRLSQCEYNAGNDAAALELFANTISTYPGTPAAHEAQRGTELALYRLSQSKDGEAVLAKLIEQFPSSPFAADAQMKIARRAYGEKRWTDAADGFRKVVSQFPGFSAADQAQFLLADCYAQAKQTDDAQKAYEQFLSFFPSSDLRPTVQFRLGLMQFDAKDYTRAAVAFTLTLEDTASGEVTAAALYNLALCHRLLNQSEDARAELERYRASFPGDARAADIAYQLGDLADAAGKPEEAAREFEAGLAAHPSLKQAPELAYRLGHCREQIADPSGALRAYVQASLNGASSDPFRLSAVARCAALYEAKRQYGRAIESYRDLIRNAKDRELVAAATERASQLEAASREH